jgi:diketogulonate reductase-like aldo/keto reductase
MLSRPFGSTGIAVPVIGQGTWRMGETRRSLKDEIAALRLGFDLGMTHVDAAEMYADGRAEEIVGQAVAGRRSEVFITTKVMPSNASYTGTLRACERSLRRLNTDYVDLYLIHWWSPQHPVAETVRALEDLVARGLTRYIGVSNFDVAQMQAAEEALTRERLACNQVVYHLRDRSVENRVLPYCEAHGMAVVGCSPFDRAGVVRGAVADIARRHGRTARQVTLNFLTRRASLFTISQATRPEQVRENAATLEFTLTPEELHEIDGSMNIDGSVNKAA